MDKKEQNKIKTNWDAQRILYAFIYDSDEDGCLPNVDDLQKSTYKIGHQRFYAALRAYGKNPEWFYRKEKTWWSDNRDTCRMLLGKTRSPEKMREFRNLIKEHLRKGIRNDYLAKTVDTPEFLQSEMEIRIAFCKLMEYRKKLYAIEDIWGGLLECSRSVGVVINVTREMTRKYILPMCQIIDRMLILLMGDDYDKSYSDDELKQFGYPDVTDEEFDQMIRDEWG